MGSLSSLASILIYCEYSKSPFPTEQNAISLPAPQFRPETPLLPEHLTAQHCEKELLEIRSWRWVHSFFRIIVASRKYPPSKDTYILTGSRVDKTLPTSIIMPSQSSKTPSERSMISGSGSRYASTPHTIH